MKDQYLVTACKYVLLSLQLVKPMKNVTPTKRKLK